MPAGGRPSPGFATREAGLSPPLRANPLEPPLKSGADRRFPRRRRRAVSPKQRLAIKWLLFYFDN